jgi:hypothetical protein
MTCLVGYCVNLLVIGGYDRISETIYWMLTCGCLTLVMTNMFEYVIHMKMNRFIGMSLIILSYILNMITYRIGYSSDTIITNTCIRFVGNVVLACGMPVFFLKFDRKVVLKLLSGALIASCIYNSCELLVSIFIRPNPCQFAWWVVLYNSSSSMLYWIYFYIGIKAEEIGTNIGIILCILQSVVSYSENYLLNSFCVSDASSFLRVSIPILCAHQLLFVACMVSNQIVVTPTPDVQLSSLDVPVTA